MQQTVCDICNRTIIAGEDVIRDNGEFRLENAGIIIVGSFWLRSGSSDVDVHVKCLKQMLVVSDVTFSDGPKEAPTVH